MGRLAAHARKCLDRICSRLPKSLVDFGDSIIEGSAASLRKQALSHEEAFGLMLARLWAFPLFRMEKFPGAQPGSLSDRELASRLSYFCGHPHQIPPEHSPSKARFQWRQLRQQVERMLLSPKVRRLATNSPPHGFRCMT